VFLAARRREQAGDRMSEGLAPYVLAALGGVSLMLLWLKLGALFGWRDVAAAQFRWSYLVAVAIVGALLALISQVLWGYAGAAAVKRLGGDAPARDLRTVWGASDFPQVLALLLLPLDLMIVGSDTFTSERLEEPLATAWAALSIAFGASLVAWTVYIFVRGVEVAGSLGWLKAAAVSLLAIVCSAVVVGGSVATVLALGGGG
jgi:hypothetical protein